MSASSSGSPRVPARRGERAVVPAAAPASHSPGDRLADALLDVLGHVPRSHEPVSADPAEAVRRLTARAARQAASAAGALALPPGPLGWLTVLPELMAVWRIQAQLVADIAAVHGRQGQLGREQMLWCLFKHTASQAVRDLVVRAGERWLVKKAGAVALRAAARRVGVKITQQGVAKATSRWLPVVGAMGVAAYAWHDTRQVARSAAELFERPVDVVGDGEVIDMPVQPD
ncbi:MAG: hypothetical protein HY856_08990 [Burkholderiales bacterium]|nr:hypothetical protein [Burkholderiales bacterium]